MKLIYNLFLVSAVSLRHGNILDWIKVSADHQTKLYNHQSKLSIRMHCWQSTDIKHRSSQPLSRVWVCHNNTYRHTYRCNFDTRQSPINFQSSNQQSYQLLARTSTKQLQKFRLLWIMNPFAASILLPPCFVVQQQTPDNNATINATIKATSDFFKFKFPLICLYFFSLCFLTSQMTQCFYQSIFNAVCYSVHIFLVTNSNTSSQNEDQTKTVV